MSDDNPYDLLAAADEDHRWAFGTGFTDPLAGVDTAIPAGVGAGALAACCLALGDDALIYSHRLQQWLTRAPELEEETALANIALDLLGQARMLLTRGGQAEGRGRDEDRLAFFRDEGEFRNARLAERADADWAQLSARLLVFSAWRLELCRALRDCADPVLAAITARSVGELSYHRDYAAGWVIRLGDGTALSHERMQAALDALWPLTGELFAPDPALAALAGNTAIRAGFSAAVDPVLAAATLRKPDAPRVPPAGETGRDGAHTEAMGAILAELQGVARAHREARW